jgi:hypothetical protein
VEGQGRVMDELTCAAVVSVGAPSDMMSGEARERGEGRRLNT